MGCSLVKSVFLLCCFIKRIVARAPSRYLTRKRLRVWLPKARKVGNQFMLTVFSNYLFFERKCRSTRVK